MTSTLPDELTLYPSRGKWLGVTAIGLSFVALGVWLASRKPSWVAWLAIAFFGLVAVVGLLQLFSKKSFLRLDLDGFEQSMLGRKLRCRWEDVSGFHVWGMNYSGLRTNSFVAFDRREDDGKQLAKINRAIAGGSAQLGDTFGRKPEELAALMNAFRERALSASEHAVNP